MKPRIRFVRPGFYGIPCKPHYACQSPEAVGFGATPVDAFESWRKAMPKTYIGCAWARFVRWLF